MTTFTQVDRLAEAEARVVALEARVAELTHGEAAYRDAVVRHQARVQQLADALEAALKVLGEHTWDEAGICPACYEHMTDGHGSDCGLATALTVGAAARGAK